MYVATKGGEKAIDAAHAWLDEERRGDRALPGLTLAQITEQLALSVARVMAEGSLYDTDLAALAIKQARGDLIEAIFLIRAYRTTLPRFGASNPVDTGAMDCIRRISATYKDAPGGQILGPTFDYTHRLLDFALAAEGETLPEAQDDSIAPEPKPHITGFLRREGFGGQVFIVTGCAHGHTDGTRLNTNLKGLFRSQHIGFFAYPLVLPEFDYFTMFHRCRIAAPKKSAQPIW